MMPKMTPSSVAIGQMMKPRTKQTVIQPTTPMTDSTSWKLSAATECARTCGDFWPWTSIAMSGGTQPPVPALMNIAAAPPKWATSTHVLSSELAYPGGGGGMAPGGG